MMTREQKNLYRKAGLARIAQMTAEEHRAMSASGGLAAAHNMTPRERAARTRKGWTPERRKAASERRAAQNRHEAMVKKTRPLPSANPVRKAIKPGTKEALALASMKLVAPCAAKPATQWAIWFDMTPKETSRALNSLRAGGHVVSEGGRIKMWRLAP